MGDNDILEGALRQGLYRLLSARITIGSRPAFSIFKIVNLFFLYNI